MIDNNIYPAEVTVLSLFIVIDDRYDNPWSKGCNEDKT